MIANRTVDLQHLIAITSSGVDVATFPETKAALIQKYKEIYGSDIDVSTGNADGEFINELSLMLNNILQSIKVLYSNLDVNTATGVYLDALCNLSNVHRKEATNSTATVSLTNNSSSDFSISTVEITLQDQAGTIWNYNSESSLSQSSDQIVIAAGATEGIPVKCAIYGAVKAPAGWINILVGEPNILVTQSDAAIVGSNAESDVELRARRNQYISPVGTTVLGALSAALLDIEGIKDVKIYNNQSDNNLTGADAPKDGAVVRPHSIYVIVRQNSNDVNIDEIIANTIYNKLTPGIMTNPAKNSSQQDIDNAKSKKHIPTMLDLTVESFSNMTYWKQAVPITPTITIQFSKLEDTGYSPDTPKLIYNSIQDYLNNLPIGSVPSANEILMDILMADPRQKGIPTININYSDIDLSNVGTNPDTYYNYPDYDESINYNEGTHTITFAPPPPTPTPDEETTQTEEQ